MAQGQVGRPGAVDHHPGHGEVVPGDRHHRPPVPLEGRHLGGQSGAGPGGLVLLAAPGRSQQQQAPGAREPQVAGVRHLPLRVLLGVAHEEEVPGAPAHLFGAPQHPRQVGVIAAPARTPTTRPASGAGAPVARARATGEGTKLSAAAARRTRSWVSARTRCPLGERTRETVATETPARRATSAIRASRVRPPPSAPPERARVRFRGAW